MTVLEWRKKHRRCKFCKHLRDLMMPLNCIGTETLCKAKDKVVIANIPRPFCRLYEPKA